MSKQIILSNGLRTTVDDEDFDWLSKWQWHYSKDGYAYRTENGKRIFMHKEIVMKVLRESSTENN